MVNIVDLSPLYEMGGQELTWVMEKIDAENGAGGMN